MGNTSPRRAPSADVGNTDSSSAARGDPGRTFGMGNDAVGLEVGARTATARARTADAGTPDRADRTSVGDN